MKSLALPLLTLGMIAVSSTVIAQPNYVVSEIPMPEWPDRIMQADMDGSGRQDLIVPQWSQEAGRELLVFLQRPNGSYEQQASRQVEIKPEIVAVAFADVRDEPGQELLLFSGSSVFSLSSEIASYSGNLQPLFDWNLIASVPDKRRTLFLNPIENPNSGQLDLLLPGRETYAYFFGTADGSFSKTHEFTTVNTELDPGDIPLGRGRFSTDIQINERDGIVLNVRARAISSFSGIVKEWSDTSNDDTLLNSRTWLPAATLASMSNKAATDIVYMNIGNDLLGQINIMQQNADGSYPATPSWQGSIDTSGDIRLLDFNADGLIDIVRIIDSSNEWDVYFYGNRGGRFEFNRPDQIMKFSGYDLNLSITDINQNGSPQLSISYYTIPIVGAVRNSSIVRTQLLYASNLSNNPGTGSGGSSAGSPGASQIFNSRPDFKLDETFSASSIRGLSQQIYLQTDLNSNGRLDALYLTSEGILAAKSIEASLRFADQPFWQYVPTRTITSFEVTDLNNDDMPDIILYHSNTASILVSAP
jgi:hypothetical protein